MDDEKFEQGLFDVLKKISDRLGWELTKRDPGPDTEVDTYSDSWPYETTPMGLEGWAKLAGICDQDSRWGTRS